MTGPGTGPGRRWLLQPLALLFLAIVLPLGLVLAEIVPLGQVADEPAHIMKADSLLQGELIGHREPLAGPDGRTLPREGVLADGALLTVIVALPHPQDLTPMRVDGGALHAAERVRFGHATFHELGTIASYFPVFYLPAAGAIAAAKLLGGTAYDAFMAARICNLLVAVTMGALALGLARRGRGLLFASLLLPTATALAASINQDGLIIATASLAAALATRLPSDRPPWRSGTYWSVAGLVGCICLAKPPYLPLVVLLFLPLRITRHHLRPGWLGARTATVLAILLLVAGWTWLNIHLASAPVLRPPEAAGPLWPGPRPAIFTGTDMAAQLTVLLAKPWRLVTLPLHSIWTHPDIFTQMLGTLGWLNLMLPTGLVILWAASLGLACCADMAAGPQRRDGSQAQEAGMLLAAIIVTILLIYLSQYLSFTPVGWSWISGPQGRYLIPLLPVLALALPGVGRPRPRLGRTLLLPAVAAGIAGFAIVPAAIIRFYYTGP